MARMSKAEQEFTAKYPYANVRKGATHPFEVFAGDYLCAEGRTRAQAFAEALRREQEGLITPDPDEMSTDGYRADFKPVYSACQVVGYMWVVTGPKGFIDFNMEGILANAKYSANYSICRHQLAVRKASKA